MSADFVVHITAINLLILLNITKFSSNLVSFCWPNV